MGFMSSHGHLTITTETQEDSPIIKTHPTTTKHIKQEKEADVRNYSMKQHVCTQILEGQHAYICDCQAKTYVYVSKIKLGKEEG